MRRVRRIIAELKSAAVTTVSKVKVIWPNLLTILMVLAPVVIPIAIGSMFGATYGFALAAALCGWEIFCCVITNKISALSRHKTVVRMLLFFVAAVMLILTGFLQERLILSFGLVGVLLSLLVISIINKVKWLEKPLLLLLMLGFIALLIEPFDFSGVTSILSSLSINSCWPMLIVTSIILLFLLVMFFVNRERKLYKLLTIASILILLLMLFCTSSNNMDKSIADSYQELLSKYTAMEKDNTSLSKNIEELENENKALQEQLKEAQNAEENALTEKTKYENLYSECQARCQSCPNGGENEQTATEEVAQNVETVAVTPGVVEPAVESPAVQENNSNVATTVPSENVNVGTSNENVATPDNNAPAISGKPLGDGNGNGAGNGGEGSVPPVYDEGDTVIVAPDQSVDFDNSNDTEVDDNHGAEEGDSVTPDDKPVTDEEQPTDTVEPENPSEDLEQPTVPEEPTEPEQPVVETVNLDYSIDGNIITVIAPEGFKTVEDYLYYVISYGDVTVNSITVEENTIQIEFEALAESEIEICEGLFYNGNIKSEKIEIVVSKTEVVVPSEPTVPDEPTAPVEPENPSEDLDQPTEPDEPVEAEMVINALTIRPICDTGTEGHSLQYQVVAEGTNINYEKFNVSVGEICCEGIWSFSAPAESGTATISYGDMSQTVNYTVTQIGEPPLPEETPEEEVGGSLTGISMYDASVVCGSDIQGEISFEGDVDWSKVEVEGLNGLEYTICEDGTITIHTSEVAANYVVTVSYNGSSVTTEFAVNGVSEADIVWN